MNSAFGLIGLGVMGKSLSRNLGSKGISLSLYNRHVDNQEVDVAVNFVSKYEELSEAKGFDDLSEFVKSLDRPRKVLLMVNANVTEEVINSLVPLLDKGDIVVDGGNAHYKDTNRRCAQMKLHGLYFVGTGVSGGEEGALKGPSIMPGGSFEAYEKVGPFLEVIAAIDTVTGKTCCGYIGDGGAGHFVKMVHNGIEYAEMQLLAEVYSCLRILNGMNPDEISKILENWGEDDLGSYLLQITSQLLKKKENDDWLIDKILDQAGNKGTGSWTTIAAAELGVPITMISSALFARYISAFKKERLAAAEKLSLDVVSNNLDLNELKHAYRLARIVNHHQGLHLIHAASIAYDWSLNMSEIARIWTNGCIIRSSLMEQLVNVLESEIRILIVPEFTKLIESHRTDLANIVSNGIQSGLSLPCFSAAVNAVNDYFTGESNANIIQAQRDFFGAHTYKRKDDPSGKAYHTNWLEE